MHAQSVGKRLCVVGRALIRFYLKSVSCGCSYTGGREVCAEPMEWSVRAVRVGVGVGVRVGVYYIGYEGGETLVVLKRCRL